MVRSVAGWSSLDLLTGRERIGFVCCVLADLIGAVEFGVEPGSYGESEDERLFFGELGFAKISEGDGGRDGREDLCVGEFGVDFDAGETVELELLELFEGFGGAAFEHCAEFDDAFHLKEELLGIGIFEPAVLGFAFEGLGAEALEAGVGVLLEEKVFGGAGGETLFAEGGLKLQILFALFWFGGEEGCAGGGEAMAETVGCRGGPTFGGAGPGRLFCICLIGENLCCGSHFDLCP